MRRAVRLLSMIGKKEVKTSFVNVVYVNICLFQSSEVELFGNCVHTAMNISKSDFSPLFIQLFKNLTQPRAVFELS